MLKKLHTSRLSNSYNRTRFEDYNIIRYDTIEEFNVDSKAECVQPNLPQKNMKKKKLKQTNASARLVQCKSRSVKAVQKKSEWLWRKRFVKEISFKVEGVTGDESEGGDCDEVIWGEPGGEWTQWRWRNEEGSWFHRLGDVMEEFNVDSKAEYSASTRSQKLKQTKPVPRTYLAVLLPHDRMQSHATATVVKDFRPSVHNVVFTAVCRNG